MKQRFVNDLRSVANSILNACDKLARIETIRHGFHGGETLRFSLSLEEKEICETFFKADGKALALEDFFAMAEAQPRYELNECVRNLQTILEVESAE